MNLEVEYVVSGVNSRTETIEVVDVACANPRRKMPPSKSPKVWSGKLETGTEVIFTCLIQDICARAIIRPSLHPAAGGYHIELLEDAATLKKGAQIWASELEVTENLL